MIKYSFLESDEENIACPTSRGHRWHSRSLWVRSIYQFILHAIVVTLLVALWRSRHVSLSSRCFLPSELSSASEAVLYEATVFDPSGFSQSDEPQNAFEGPPTAESNAAWAQLFDVGMYVLNEEEYRQLGRPTAEVVDRPGEFLITLEVMHQLHCLDYLRIASYAATEGKQTHHEHESDWSKAKHLNHCIDYLRQVLMCHGDLTPITLERKSGHPPYRPDFRIQHTCRNWDRIHEFAARRNTSGYGIA